MNFHLQGKEKHFVIAVLDYLINTLINSTLLTSVYGQTGMTKEKEVDISRLN